jgi:hypothetical protein
VRAKRDTYCVFCEACRPVGRVETRHIISGLLSSWCHLDASVYSIGAAANSISARKTAPAADLKTGAERCARRRYRHGGNGTGGASSSASSRQPPATAQRERSAGLVAGVRQSGAISSFGAPLPPVQRSLAALLCLLLILLFCRC